MIFDKTATPLLEKFRLAKEGEAEASKRLLAALQADERDHVVLGTLVTQMEQSTNAAADIWAQLQAIALGE